MPLIGFLLPDCVTDRIYSTWCLLCIFVTLVSPGLQHGFILTATVLCAVSRWWGVMVQFEEIWFWLHFWVTCHLAPTNTKHLGTDTVWQKWLLKITSHISLVYSRKKFQPQVSNLFLNISLPLSQSHLDLPCNWNGRRRLFAVLSDTFPPSVPSLCLFFCHFVPRTRRLPRLIHAHDCKQSELRRSAGWEAYPVTWSVAALCCGAQDPRLWGRTWGWAQMWGKFSVAMVTTLKGPNLV